MKKISKRISILLSLLIMMSPLNIIANEQEEIQINTLSNGNGTGELLGNAIVNPQLQFTESDITIPGWFISGTNDVGYGTTNNLKLNSQIVNNKRSLVNGTPPYEGGDTAFPKLLITKSNNASNFLMSSTGVDNNMSFQMISQTVNGLTAGEKYIFSLDYRLSGTSKLYAVIYNETATSGGGALTSTTFTESTADYVTSEIPFTATSPQATLSFRNYYMGAANQISYIKSAGFYRVGDFDFQKDVFNLFENMTSGNEALKETVTTKDVQDLYDKIDTIYSPEVRTEVVRLLDIASGILQIKANIQNKIDDLYVDGVIRDDAADYFDAISTELEKLNDGTLKDALTSELNEAKDALELFDSKNTAKDDLEQKGTEQKNVIDNNPNLTPEEKQEAKDAIDQAIIDGKAVIDNSTTPGEVESAVEDTNAAIDKAVTDTILQNAKNSAKTELRTYADAKILNVTNNPNLGAEVKSSYITSINAIYTSSVENIDIATTVVSIESIVTTAKDDMNAVELAATEEGASNLANQKAEAKDDLDKKGTEQKTAIDNNPNLTPEEKQEAKDAIDQAITDGKTEIDNSTMPNEIETIVEDTNNTIDQIVNDTILQNAKNSAKADLRAYADAKITSVTNNASLSGDAKTTYIASINSIYTTAAEEIDTKTTVVSIEPIVTTAKDEMDAVELAATEEGTNNLANQKTEAKDDLDKKGTEQKTAIDNNPNLTEDEKKDAKDAIDKAITDGKTEIDNSTTPSEVENVVEDTNTAIDQIVNDTILQNAKNSAKEELRTYADAKIASVTNNASLSEEAKTTYIASINSIYTTAATEIDATLVLTDITPIVSSAKTNMDAIELTATEEGTNNLANQKAEAKDDLDKKGTEQKTAIDNNPNLTEDEKKDAKDAIDKAITDGKTAIDNSTTPSEVENVVEDTNTAIDQIVNDTILQNAKNSAKAELRIYADNVIEAINSNTSLTAAQKESYVTQINAIVESAIVNIDTATEIAQIQPIVDTAKTAIDNVKVDAEEQENTNVEEEKEQAKDDLDKKGEDAKNAIDNNPELTDEEKENAKKEIDDAVAKGKEDIDNGATVPEIEDIEKDTDEKINDIVEKYELEAAKNKALNELRTYADNVLETIISNISLTEAQKESYATQINSIVGAAIVDINSATEIAQIQPIVDTAKTAIDNVKVDAEEQENTNVEEEKEQAKDDLDKKGEDAKNVIDNKPELTDEEKENAKKEIDDAVAKGKEDIDNGATVPEIEGIEKETDEKINDIVEKYELQAAKTKALNELRTYADNVLETINSNTSLTATQKESYVTQINAIVGSAIVDINSATEIGQIQPIVDTAKTAINNVKVDAEEQENTNVEEEKEQAKDDLDKKGEDAKNAIDNNPELTDEEKENAKKEIDDAVAKGKEEIDNGATVPEIEDIEKDTDEKINDIVEKYELQAAKNKAIKELIAYGENAKDIVRNSQIITTRINENKSLTPEQIEAYVAEVDAIVASGITNIQVSETITAVEKSLQDAKDEIDAVIIKAGEQQNSNVKEEKDNAKDDLDKKGEDAKNEIDNNTELTDEEKENAKKEIDDTVAKGKEDIDNGKTVPEIEDIEKETDEKINDIVGKYELQAAKSKALKELRAYADNVLATINANTSLTEAQKESYAIQINTIVESATVEINGATDIAQIQPIVDTAIIAIDNVKVNAEEQENTNVEEEKAKAKDELDKKGEDAKNAIDNNPNLTDKEKDEAKKEIDDAIANGKETIDNGTSVPEIENNEKETEEKMDEIIKKTELQGAKNKAKIELQAYAEEKIAEINDMQNLSSEEKEKFINEINTIVEEASLTIDNATTIPEVETNLTNAKTAIDAVGIASEELNEKNGAIVPALPVTGELVYEKLAIGFAYIILGFATLFVFVAKRRKQ